MHRRFFVWYVSEKEFGILNSESRQKFLFVIFMFIVKMLISNNVHICRARHGRNRIGCNAHKETRVQIVAALLPEEGVSEADGWCPRRNRNNCKPHNASRVQELLHGL